MNLKATNVILLAVILVQVCGVAARGGPADTPPAADAAKPEVDAVDSIYILVNSGWILRVRPDGSGRLQYGSGPTDGAIFAAGSIDFNKVFTQLPEHGEDTGEKDTVAVSIQCRSDAKAISRSLSSQAAGPLFVQAAEKARARDEVHFEQLRKSHPFMMP